MAMDSSWDNSGLPPQKKGMATWVKVLGGCGIVFLLVLGGCAVAAYSCVRSVSNLGGEQWPTYVAAVKALQDPTTTKALYDRNPGLKKDFPEEHNFEEQVAKWRPAIQTPPVEMPSIYTGLAFLVIRTKNSHVLIGSTDTDVPDDGQARAAVGYQMTNGRLLIIEWKNSEIVRVRFEGRSRDRSEPASQ